jgi:hypothetical protein
MIETTVAKLHEEIFVLRAECESFRVRIKTSERVLQEVRKKLIKESKAHIKSRARLESLEPLQSEVVALRSQNAALAGELREERARSAALNARLEDAVGLNQTSARALEESQTRTAALEVKLKAMNTLTGKCMAKMRATTAALRKGKNTFVALIKEHKDEVSSLFAFDTRELNESISRTFKQMLVPVNSEFHRSLFTRGKMYMAQEEDDQHQQDQDARDSIMQSIWDNSESGGYDSRIIQEMCNKDGPLWFSLRRAIMDFWKVNSWDLMQQSVHNLIQMFNLYLESKIGELHGHVPATAVQHVPAAAVQPLPAAAAQPLPAVVRSPGLPKLEAYRECFSLPRIPAMIACGPEMMIKIVNRLELVSARMGTPWHSNCRIYMEREHCSFVADAMSRLFLETQGVFAFDIGTGFVFRFATVPLAYRRNFVSQGYTAADLWRVQADVARGGLRYRTDSPTSSKGIIRSSLSCMHTSDVLDVLNNMIDTSEFQHDDMRAAYLLRTAGHFIMTTPHIAMVKLFMAYRNEMMEKHKRTILDVAAEQFDNALEGLADTDDRETCSVRSFSIPSINLPARAIHIPPLLKFMIVHRHRKLNDAAQPASLLARSMTLSRGIRMRAYVNYHDEPNLGALDEMDSWISQMNVNASRGFDEKTVESTSSPLPTTPCFKFAYARMICLGLYIHAYIFCPTRLRHHFLLTSMANEVCVTIQQSLCKLLGSLPSPQTNEVNHILWDSAYNSQMKIFFDDVKEAVTRAIDSDYLMMFATKGTTPTHPKFT